MKRRLGFADLLGCTTRGWREPYDARDPQQIASTKVATLHVKLIASCLAPVAAVGLQGDYTRGHDERLPYTDGSMRSIYHIRDFEVYRLMQVCRWRSVGLGWSLVQARNPALFAAARIHAASQHSVHFVNSLPEHLVAAALHVSAKYNLY